MIRIIIKKPFNTIKEWLSYDMPNSSYDHAKEEFSFDCNFEKITTKTTVFVHDNNVKKIFQEINTGTIQTIYTIFKGTTEDCGKEAERLKINISEVYDEPCI